MGKAKVTLVRADFRVQAGDPGLAYSDPKYLPVELLIGYVSSCEVDENNPVFWQVMVRPAADPHALREVVVVNTMVQEKQQDK